MVTEIITVRIQAQYAAQLELLGARDFLIGFLTIHLSLILYCYYLKSNVIIHTRQVYGCELTLAIQSALQIAIGQPNT